MDDLENELNVLLNNNNTKERKKTIKIIENKEEILQNIIDFKTDKVDEVVISKYSYLEVCAGCGGLSYGLECAGLKAEVLIEMEKNCVKTLKTNFKNTTIIGEDMRKIDYKKYRGKIDIVVGGIPCQSYSIAGKREGLDNADKGGLFYDYLRILDEIEPKMFMIENVEGLLSIDGGDTIKYMIKELESRNYNVNYKVLDCRYFNIAQKRRRLIIVGTTSNVDFIFPEPFNNILTMQDALKNVPNSSGTEYSEKKKQVMDLVPPGGCWINLPDDVKKEYMGASLNSGGGKRGIARRLSWNEACLTLTTSPCQKQTERCHPSETRPLRTREYARIQTFPDDFIFEGSVTNIYKQIGNAVPCMLGYYLGIQIRKTLDSIVKKKLILELNKKYLNKEITSSHNLMELSEICNLTKLFFKEHIISISEEPVNRKLTTIDAVKKETDKIIYNLTNEEWEKFDNTRLRDKQINNKIGELHEFLLAKAKNYIKCNTVDKTIQADIMKTDKSVFIELKNKYNTMNSAAKQETIKRLTDIKKKYPESLCLIGIINGKNNSSYKKKVIETPEIWEYCGEELFNLIFNDKNYFKTVENIIINGLKLWIDEYKLEKKEIIDNVNTKINKQKEKEEDIDDIDILKDNPIKTIRTKTNIKIVDDEETTKSTKSNNLTKSVKKAPSKKSINKSAQKPEPKPIPEIELELELDDNGDNDDSVETVLVGKVECIQLGNKYYKYTNGNKGDIYAITNGFGKTVLYKKPVIKKVEMNDDLDELQKESGSIPKMNK